MGRWLLIGAVVFVLWPVFWFGVLAVLWWRDK
jgi:hypothetical protein